MAFFDFVTDLLGGGARSAAEEQARGIAEAQEYMQGLQTQYQEAISPMGDPQAFYSQMMTGYEESPQAQMARQQGLQAAQQGAAASGMLGSGELLKGLQQYGQQLTGADQQQWLQNMLGIYGGYTGGLGNIMTGGSDIADLMSQAGIARGQEATAQYSPYTQWLGKGLSMLGGGTSGVAGAPGIGGGGGLMGLV